MKPHSKVYLRMMSKLLKDFMEIANKIDLADYQTIVNKARQDKSHVKGILDNAGRGNLFMVAFFLREMIENILID